MRKLLLLLVLLAPLTAFAQEPAQSVAPSLEEMLQQTEKKQEMPKVGRDLANLYYKSCMNRQQDNLRKEAQELICGCTSAKIAENLSVREIQDLISKSGTTGAAHDKFLMFVYPPCMRLPAEDFAKTSCMADPQYETLAKGRWKICDCTATAIGNHIEKNYPKIIVEADRVNPDTLDPLNEYIATSAYKNLYKHTTKQCFQEFAYGTNKPERNRQ